MRTMTPSTILLVVGILVVVFLTLPYVCLHHVRSRMFSVVVAAAVIAGDKAGMPVLLLLLLVSLSLSLKHLHDFAAGADA